MSFFLCLYDYFHHRRTLLWGLLAVIVVALGALVTRIEYKEDISDFMPFDAEYRKAMQVYQEVAAGDRVVLLFGMADSSQVDQEYVAAGVERFGEVLAEKDTAHWVTDWQPQVDAAQVLDIFSFVYENLPIFLTEADYARMDSLMAADPQYIEHKLQNDYEQIGSLAGSFMQPMLQNDPLGVGTRMASVLRQYQPELQFEQYDGYVFTPDGKRCMVTFSSPFGNVETDCNARLVQLIDATLADVRAQEEFALLDACAIGAPVIAVANASQIKHDSILAVLISAVLILALMLYAFRSFKSLLQIAIATGFGFLFALGFLGIFRDTLSVIVLGIASIIIGIAVNYPLHYLCHIQHEPNPRTTLKELVTPLFIGNVTTVGAFLTLVPLDAVAIRDLGLFSALMLVGTIIFVLVFMPHIPMFGKTESAPTQNLEQEVHTFDRLAERLIGSRATVLALLIITAVLGWFSLRTQFDSNLNHINYMTSRQRADMEYVSSLQGQSQGNTVFISASAASADEALMAFESIQQRIVEMQLDTLVMRSQSIVDLLVSSTLQQQHIADWRAFWQRHGFGDGLSDEFRAKAEAVGFAADAFSPFENLLTGELDVVRMEDFEPVTSTVLTGRVRDGQLVAQFEVPASQVRQVEEAFTQALPRDLQVEFHIFDLASLNSRVSDALSDNFNYIGYACSLIVFLFLWFSFQRIELALIAFLPMVIGWIWILGLMELFGIQFNIVNVILATFIFGQGDDYTIFVTEGLVREYREGRRVLVSYQRSILLSALIMLIGIGSLILSKHPAMHSLASVTIIGMAVVVLMAWIIPPMVFRGFVRYDGSFRRYLAKENK